MERVISTEDKIRRAEEIYNRRREQYRNGMAKVNIKEKKEEDDKKNIEINKFRKEKALKEMNDKVELE